MNYALVKIEDGSVVTEFIGAIPNPVVWPNGDASHCAGIGDERAGCRLVEIRYESPRDFHESISVRHELDGDKVFFRNEWKPVDLGLVKQELLARIDMRAEEERTLHSTSGAGQALVYQHKLTQAENAIRRGSAQPGDYPLVDASRVNGEDILAAAHRIIAASQVWMAIMADIEQRRLSAKARVATAQSVDEAMAAEVN